MKINIGSFMFNIDLKSGGTPSWGTELGQKAGYNFDVDKLGVDIFASMINNSIDLSLFDCKLGKGGKSENYDILIASLFDKVFVNNQLIKNAKFLLFIVREHNKSHNGRKELKYSRDAKYQGISYNNECIIKIKEQFNLQDDSPWIVTNIDFLKQNELHFKAYFFDGDKKTFSIAKDRTAWVNSNIDQLDIQYKDEKLRFLIEKFNKVNCMINQRWSAIHYFAFIYFKELEEVNLNELYNKLGINEAVKYDSFKLEIEKAMKLAKNVNNYKIDNSIISNFEIPGTAKNLVVFGTPGCGKSYYVDNELLKKDDYPIKYDNTKERVFRTTFYQDYSNSDFVGQILPYIEYNEKMEEKVTYKFTPGPFALALKEAVLNINKPVALVIEELNRGNAPAIFGDIFQLLDRNEYGISEYAITNVHLRDWLNNEIDGACFDKIKIPGNLNIFATMNTSDQNVFTLDTAFKRRWEFKKLKNEFKGHQYKDYFVPGLEETTWKTFVEVINKAIIGEHGERNSSINVSDKQIGVYFVDKDGLYEEQVNINNLNNDEKIDKFAYKVFSYLWDDVAKFDKDQLFRKGIITLDQLIDNYIKHEVVFKDEIHKLLVKKASESSEDK